MIIFDQLKRDDKRLRMLAGIMLTGLGVLLAGLWWVQIVSFQDYQQHLENQSFRSVRIPAVRGQILDRNGVVLAGNRPAYNICLYLEDLHSLFIQAYNRNFARARAQLRRQMAQQTQRLHRALTRQERRAFLLNSKREEALRRQGRFEVASNVVAQISRILGQPLSLDAQAFEHHYETRLALPYPVLSDLNPTQIARFEEHSPSPPGADIETESIRIYPYGTVAAHVLGYLRRDDSSKEGEVAFFSYYQPDYRGVVGIEAGFNKELRGMAGGKSVLVNNLGFRQAEEVWSDAQPGENVVLAIDARLEKAAQQALQGVDGPDTRGAVVVMNVNTGDLLAMVSSPSFDPNLYVQGFTPQEWQRLNDPKLRPQINRATQDNFQPGSIFKTVTGLAALETGLNPHALYTVAPNPRDPNHGVIWVDGHPFGDLARPGEYDFRRAFKRSSNAYFINAGLHAGIENIVELARRFHLGQRTDMPTRQEVPGIFPTLNEVRSRGWYAGDSANICIGQGRMAVTPVQMAVVISALANGGKVLWPRLVIRTEPQSDIAGEKPEVFPKHRVRDELDVDPRNLQTVREGMLADVEDPDGTGTAAAVPGLRIAGKTGTAQVKNIHGITTDHTTWFASFAPYEHPKYAVIVMVQSGRSGGATCAPVARQVYTAIQECERLDGSRLATVANN